MNSKYKRVIIACPGDGVSGGPELLHQLGTELRELGCDAYMAYLPTEQSFSCPEPYKKYGVPQGALVDEPGVAVVLPEIYTGKALQFKASQAIVWWLSVDVYLKMYSSLKNRLFSFVGKLSDDTASLAALKPLKHMAQSQYALDFLERNGLEATFLSDYLSDEHFQAKPVAATRKNIIIYNPTKGIKQTNKLIQTYHNYQFLPLRGFTSEQVHAALSSAKLYIDFGHHPGKDRMPREAAIAGCCIITNLKGSAKFNDVEIPPRYKLDDSKKDFVKQFGQLAKLVMENFDFYARDFEEYRQKIREEQQSFIQDVRFNFF